MNAVEMEIIDDDKKATIAFSKAGWCVTYNGQVVDCLDGNALKAYLQQHGFIRSDAYSNKLTGMIDLISDVGIMPQ